MKPPLPVKIWKGVIENKASPKILNGEVAISFSRFLSSILLETFKTSKCFSQKSWKNCFTSPFSSKQSFILKLSLSFKKILIALDKTSKFTISSIKTVPHITLIDVPL